MGRLLDRGAHCEVPVAFVQLKAQARITPDTLIAWCRENLANFKVPRAVYFVDALPYHTAAHGAKLQRHVLREWARERAATTPTRLPRKNPS